MFSHIFCAVWMVGFKRVESSAFVMRETYKRRHMKQLKQASETLTKMSKNTWKLLQTYAASRWNTCNQHTYETPETLETYTCNMHVYAISKSTFATSR